MTTLVTGGTGKIGQQLIKLLQAANKPYVIASRNGDAPPTTSHSIKFDWSDPNSFSNPFSDASDIENLYLISPPRSSEPLNTVKPFVDLAVEKGVKKIVLVSASQMEKGGPFIGKLHEYLDGLSVDYTVLRPTWFIGTFLFYSVSKVKQLTDAILLENLAGGHISTIKKDSQIWSYVGDGRIPFVSVVDIAQAAFDAFFNKSTSARGRQPILLGPELLSHDEVCVTILYIITSAY
jgi:festuclavine dehydrogenase